ncbi:MAG: hypothetical protein QM501_07270, partial [Gimesia sp.]
DWGRSTASVLFCIVSLLGKMKKNECNKSDRSLSLLLTHTQIAARLSIAYSSPTSPSALTKTIAINVPKSNDSRDNSIRDSITET